VADTEETVLAILRNGIDAALLGAVKKSDTSPRPVINPDRT
jgi:hypothetical protein